MYEILKNMLTGRSEFASGGLLLMLIGGLSVYLRAIPLQVWYWIVGQTTMTITVKDDDCVFQWVKEWFLEQDFLRKIRRVDLDTSLRNERVAMMPAPGKHWFWYRGRPFEVWFSRTENARERTGRRVETFTFRTLGRKREFLQGLVNDVVECHNRRQGVQSYLYTFDEGWNYVRGYSPRPLDSVVLEPGEKEHLLEDVSRFRKSKLRYASLGVPYHRGYLFYGPPGTGKTSLVSALAAHFNLSIYVINLTDFTDRSLMSAVNWVPVNSIVLFEDIDCMQSSQSRFVQSMNTENKTQIRESNSLANRVTLSGLLNVLDGFHAPSGVLFVMTTNHVEKLDAALLRPGRIDYKLYLGEASNRQKTELYRKFFPDASESEAREFVESSQGIATMAEFQGLLLALDNGSSHDLPEVAEEVLA